MRSQFSATVTVFVGLLLVYLLLIITTGRAGEPNAHSSITTMISALFGGGLAFFLVRLFQIAEERRWGR